MTLPPRCCGTVMREYRERVCDHCGRIELHDIHDSRAFVAAEIRKVNLQLTIDERDELIQAGMQRLIRMARDYRPGIGGRDAAGSRFSGFAAQWLPRKLSDEYHRLKGFKLRTLPDGSRAWNYDEPVPVSLQALIEHAPNALDTIASLATVDAWEHDLVAELPRLLAARREREDELLQRYAELRRDGYTHGDTIFEMRVTPAEGKLIRSTLEWLIRQADTATPTRSTLAA